METVPIPEPPGLPFLGNIGDINSEYPLGSLVHLAETYGPIFRLRLPGKNIVVVSTNALVNEACNEQRFNKRVEAALKVSLADCYTPCTTMSDRPADRYITGNPMGSS